MSLAPLPLIIFMFSILLSSRVGAFVVQGVRAPSSRWISQAKITTQTEGVANTESFRLVFKDGEKKISPWHDIPLYTEDGLVNLITEIPKFTKAKMEVDTKMLLNPIKQDMKKGKLRDYHGPIYWNYGCLPQTWENPNILHNELNCYGDNDPLDVIEIGSSILSLGSITPIKPLGIFAMIDDGELDWKIIGISKNDILFNELNSIEDVNNKLPGTISGIREWFRWYKTPDQKPLNQFGYHEECLHSDKAYEIIKETHHSWKSLKDGKVEPNGLSIL
mmetsp:Transcript_52407/g.67217  ORF Transcript_52407/g.67217 Transcript_52407/m.67217 type:complete len:276 (-) Transcript_52407:76-903(-)